MRKYLYRILIIVFALVFLGSAAYLVNYLLESKKQKDYYDELAGLVQQEEDLADLLIPDATNPDGSAVSPNNPSKYITVTNAKTGEPMRMLRKYSIVYQRNADLVGWIKIPGTKINYPVLQSPEEENFYLTRDFYKNESKYGAIYANELGDVTIPTDNIILYGHKMADGSMFASLHNYSDVDFYIQNEYITFDTLFEEHTYQIFAIFTTTADFGDGFAYHTFMDMDEETFTEFVQKCKDLSLYKTYLTAEYGDKLLTLSTCDHSIDNGRYVVVAKRVS